MRTLLLAIILTVQLPLNGQNSPGTEHWVAFMENLDLQFNNAPSFHLVISSEYDATGQVVVPATGYTIPYSIPAGADTVIDLPQNIYYSAGDEVLFNFGLRVSADVPVNVYAYHDRVYFSDASLILPTSMLGTDYLVVAHEDDSDLSPSEFVVLATEPGTVVEITPSVLTSNFRPPGVPFTVALNEGQTIQIQAYENLSGSHVRSLDPLKPIAVFGGARQARVNCPSGGADDHLYNQVYPVQTWARNHLVVPFSGRGGDHVRLLALSNGTEVSIAGTTFLLDSGDVAETNVGVPSLIQSNNPIAVGQFNDSQYCNGASGDPCFLFLPPQGYRDLRCIWNSRDGDGTPEHFVNIVVQGGSGVDPMLLDDVDIADQFEPVPDVSGQWFAQVSIVAGHHELISEKPFQAVAYGFGEYNSYSFALGFETEEATGMDELNEGHSATTQALAQGEAWWPNWTVTANEDIRVMDARGRLVARATLRLGSSIDLRLDGGVYLYERWSNAQRIGTGRLIVR